MRKFKCICLLCFAQALFFEALAQEEVLNLNKPAREAWFTAKGFGLFIHWSFDVQLGMVISHSMVGASADYLDRYVNQLPQTFNPQNFEPSQWARSAKMAGMKYVVFTTKHHNGFCMFDTPTTDFKVTNTPFGRDVTREVIDAFRKEGLAIGIYFSPDDFHFLYRQGTEISRRRPEALASGNPELNEFAKKQMRELMTRYGKIDIVFLDGMEQYAKTELAKVCWKLNPDVVVTRGAMETPEQNIPNKPIPAPWEACFTLGDQWQFRPTNENYKSGTELINKLIEIRGKGGNFLLNIGPDADGAIPAEQAGRLNELALWYFINGEAIEGIEPWTVTREGDIWFTRKKGTNTVYAILTGLPTWQLGERKEFILKSVKGSVNTKVTVLGQNSKVLEYQPDSNPACFYEQTDDGFSISVMRAHRIYNDRKWPNPIVVKLENVLPVD